MGEELKDMRPYDRDGHAQQLNMTRPRSTRKCSGSGSMAKFWPHAFSGTLPASL
jgi:hypothetical protein